MNQNTGGDSTHSSINDWSIDSSATFACDPADETIDSGKRSIITDALDLKLLRLFS